MRAKHRLTPASQRVSEAAKVMRWRKGQEAAARRQLELVVLEGPDRDQAVAEALSAYELTQTIRSSEGSHDPIRERDVMEVRRRWARIQKRAQALR